MSFILDALRKSEHERQRQTGPAMVEAAVAPPKKPQSNRWATAAIALLVLNLVASAWCCSGNRATSLRRWPRRRPRRRPLRTSRPPRPLRRRPRRRRRLRSKRPSPARCPSRRLRRHPCCVRQSRRPATGRRGSLEQEMSADVPPMEYEAAQAAARPPARPVRRGADAARFRGVRVAARGSPWRHLRTTPGGAPALGPANLPTADELTARGGLAEMRLELHVYSTRAQDRIVFVNGRRYREGDTTAEGATVVQITPDGAIMTAGGNRFLLTRD